MPEARARFALTMEVEEAEEGGYDAVCVELGTPSCGDTIDEALRNIQEAVMVHLDSLIETGDLGRVLREKGIAVESTETTAQSEIDAKRGAVARRISRILDKVSPHPPRRRHVRREVAPPVAVRGVTGSIQVRVDV